MLNTIHFISGLPRSGSTLLAAVLRQNPRLLAGMTSPVAALCFALIEEMSPPAQFAASFDEARRNAVLRGVFSGFYGQADPATLIFDTNRVWTGNLPLLEQLYPNGRVICCVRDIGWIIDSIERIHRRNPSVASRIFPGTTGRTIYARVEALMNAEIGLIGAAWGNLREAWFSTLADRLLVISYDGFVSDPAGAMRRLYHALEEPFFQHDFNHLQYDATAYDADLGLPGLHRVAPRIARAAATPVIPPELFNKYANSTFWRPDPGRIGGPTVIC